MTDPTRRASPFRLGLDDLILGIAALAPGLALLRRSGTLGLAALVVAIPAAARTSLLARRLRAEGALLHAGHWAAGFASSTGRIGLVLGLSVATYRLGLAAGEALGARAAAPAPTPILGALAGFLLAILATALVLGVLAPRLLPLREGQRD